MSPELDLDLAPREGAPVDEPPADVSDEGPDIDDIRNGDLTSSQADPTAVAPTSDPDPAAMEADFPGRPLSDDEVAALPVEELDGT
jgi:hypothetical protein